VTAHPADLVRIEAALREAGALLATLAGRPLTVERKAGGDPVTEADRRVDALLREELVRPGEGWLSEESADDPARLACRRVWVVDPLDGTKEFIAGIPEWTVSIGLVEGNRAVAGGIFNPTTGELFLGAAGAGGGGVTRDGRPVRVAERAALAGATVLASRSEVARGDWERWRDAPFTVVPTGSIAYKLARVAAGLADATWTRSPRHEWDVAAGTALVVAAGGEVRTPDGGVPSFNRPRPLLPGLAAGHPRLLAELAELTETAAAR
jgi:myo-inositol-1(or 4)-monophosphatase